MNKGFTQKSLAEAVGLHVNSISLTESGTHMGPTETHMRKIANVLGVDVDDILEFRAAREARRQRMREGFWERIERKRLKREASKEQANVTVPD